VGAPGLLETGISAERVELRLRITSSLHGVDGLVSGGFQKRNVAERLLYRNLTLIWPKSDALRNDHLGVRDPNEAEDDPQAHQCEILADRVGSTRSARVLNAVSAPKCLSGLALSAAPQSRAANMCGNYPPLALRADL